MGIPKRFTLNGHHSLRLGALVRLASRRMLVGHGPFSVDRGHFRHPGLKKGEAAAIIRAMCKDSGMSLEIRVHDGKGKLVAHIRRAPVSPVCNDPYRDAVTAAMRVDAGGDMDVRGPIYAVGPAIIHKVGKPSGTWTFGPDLMVLQFLPEAGPLLAGKFYFLAEHYRTAKGLKAGQHVDANTVIAEGYGAIEQGWSNGTGSMAWGIDPNIEGQRTRWGQNWSDLLVALGAKASLATGRALTMTLPASWPRKWKGKV